MAPYRQACSSCTGQSVTAQHDVERYQNDLRWQRSLERLARSRAANPNMRRGGDHSSTSEDYTAEADHHGALARALEAKLARAQLRLLRAIDPRPCLLCGGIGYIQAPGTFVRGANRQVAS